MKASPEKIYKAFLDPEAVVLWLPPNDMRGHMFEFEAKAGGNYRMSLSYIGEEYANKGKTSENTDVIKGAFKEFVLNERIIQLVEFESEDPIFAGEMQMTWKLEQDPKGTLVSIACEHVPEGIKKEDHEIGLRSTLENLANYVETSREMV
nr:SRPBCC domain-containing protein [Sutcliffiella rhizosphaerae]